MSRARGADQRAVLCLVATAVLCAAACSPSERSGSPSQSPSAIASASTATPGSGAAGSTAVLERAFVGRESLGSGSGQLQSQFGNTHPGTPEGVLSVTFAFTCTGNAKIALKFSVGGKEVPSAAGTQACDGSIFQRSIDVPKPGPLSFEAAVNGSDNGSFAYAYYAEKKQLP
jgi:hypothetical protein